MKINAQKFTVNGSDQDWTHNRYVLWFGACAPTKLLVYANSLESALDECAGWIEDNAPGLFCDDAVADEYEGRVAAGDSVETAQEAAEVDCTVLDRGHYLSSEEWGIHAENPTRGQLAEIFGAQ